MSVFKEINNYSYNITLLYNNVNQILFFHHNKKLVITTVISQSY